MKGLFWAAATAAGLLAAGTASAAAGDNAVGVNLGTPGIGLEVQHGLNDRVVLRGDVDFLSYSHDDTLEDVNYEGKLKFTTAGVFADLHPTGGSFFLSGGAYLGTRKFDLRAVPTSNVDIGSTTYTPAQVGTITGEAKFSSFAPFVGLGFDNTMTSDSAWGFRSLIGVAFSGSPDVKLNCSGAVCSTPGGQANFAAEARTTEDDLNSLKYYPTVQFGVTRKF